MPIDYLWELIATKNYTIEVKINFINIETIVVHSKACIRNIFNEKKIEIINRSEIVKTAIVKLTFIINVKHIVYQMIERLERWNSFN